MGTSTDAILFYGYELGEDPAIDSDLDKPWEDLEERVAFLLAKEEGLEEPPSQFDWAKEAMIEFRASSRDLLKDLGVELGIHGHYEYPVYYLSVKEFRAYRGDAQLITKTDMTPPDNALERLDRFCELAKITVGKPELGTCVRGGAEYI